MLTSKNTAWDFDPTPQVGILPLACFEPHGPHLPIGTDIILMSAISEGVAKNLPDLSFLLPTWPVGVSLHQESQKGTISLENTTLWSVVRDVVISLHDHGIHQVVVLNNHGTAATTNFGLLGNAIVKTAVRQLNYETPGLTVIWVQPFSMAREALRAIFASAERDVHAGAVETSLMMHLVPEKVGELPSDFHPTQNPAWLEMLPFEKMAPAGVWGAPQEASAEKGGQAFDAIITIVVGYITDTFAQLAKIKGRI